MVCHLEFSLANVRHGDVAGSPLVPGSYPKVLNNNLWQSFQNMYMLLWIGGGRFNAKGQRVLPGICVKMRFTVSSNYAAYQKL